MPQKYERKNPTMKMTHHGYESKILKNGIKQKTKERKAAHYKWPKQKDSRPNM